jgi:hypothetical protein
LNIEEQKESNNQLMRLSISGDNQDLALRGVENYEQNEQRSGGILHREEQAAESSSSSNSEGGAMQLNRSHPLNRIRVNNNYSREETNFNIQY